MVSIPVLIAYVAVITIYLTGCLIIHLRDIHDAKQEDRNSRSDRSMPKHGGPHASHP